MGEFEQPVVGMKSSFDLSENESEEMCNWSAREWFMVRKAEVQMSESNMLIPMARMGVEAREQTVKGNSLLDVPMTRPDHPMVKYAEACTTDITDRRHAMQKQQCGKFLPKLVEGDLFAAP